MSARIGTEPMKIALLVDNGEAMRAGQAVNPMRDAAAAFLETLPPQHVVSLFTIGGQIRQVADFTTDRGETGRKGAGASSPTRPTGSGSSTRFGRPWSAATTRTKRGRSSSP